MDCSMSVARWSRGMICASDARGPGFKSRTSPIFHSYYQKNGENLSSNTLNKAQIKVSRPVWSMPTIRSWRKSVRQAEKFGSSVRNLFIAFILSIIWVRNHNKMHLTRVCCHSTRNVLRKFRRRRINWMYAVWKGRWGKYLSLAP